MQIGEIILDVSHCITGIYLRWWYNGWHYYNFQNGYDNLMSVEDQDIQTSRMFSRISKVERPTKIKTEYAYGITLEGISPVNILGFIGILLAERIEQYEDSLWREVELTRGDHLIKDEDTGDYILNFEIIRKELSNIPAVYQKSIKLYLGDTLCDLDDDEIIPINKQVNDIAEMQDRQSDFTAQFKIRKTREMIALFEFSGEVGANTIFPYQNQLCYLIQNGIEIIIAGIMILDKSDDSYYYVSILSGNKNFFKDIENLKITDLILASTNHTWNLTDMEASQDNDLDYLYPLCDPSDDAGCGTRAANQIDMYGGWIWPFIKVKTIWDEIFANANYWITGNILTDNKFLKLWMPISSQEVTKLYADKYLYSVWWGGAYAAPLNAELGFTGAVLINGDENFRLGYYYLPFNASYKVVVSIIVLTGVPTLSIYRNGGFVDDMNIVSIGTVINYDYEVSGTAGQHVEVLTTAAYYFYYATRITEIVNPLIAYGSSIVPHHHLPALSQLEFIKMICNMFGLIPDVTPRDKKIHFWNYLELYDNIPIARDWSEYLSEREDEAEFKFGSYAQNNYLRYKDSEDVIPDNGKGNMQVDDETLSNEKDAVDIPVSTCDEVNVMTDVNISRIAFNKWDAKTSLYVVEKSIDARIVFTKQTSNTKTFRVWDTVAMNINHFDVIAPKIACSMEVSFSDLVINYQGLSRLLTNTNLRRAKFNLPVYEVAGMKHYIPIYLNQYKAYFYVNKINNYVPGRLCTIDLIKL